MKKKINPFIYSIIAFAMFIAATLWIKFYDVQPIGPEGSSVGCASLNGAIARMIKVNEPLYKITEYLGYAAILIMGIFACVGLFQLIKGKSLKSVDNRLYVLAAFYAMMIGFYVLFEVVIINYRPVILDEGLEASYPSSHTMLSLCVFLSALGQIRYLIKKEFIKDFLIQLLRVAAVFTVIGRLFSGVHWITDIIGGIILSLALLSCYHSAMSAVTNKMNNAQ